LRQNPQDFRVLLPGAQEAEALRVTVALTDVRRANPAVNAATFSVVGLATRPSVLRAEVDITDADDGTRVAALTCPGTGGVFEGRNGITRRGDRSALTKRADELAVVVADLLRTP